MSTARSSSRAILDLATRRAPKCSKTSANTFPILQKRAVSSTALPWSATMLRYQISRVRKYDRRTNRFQEVNEKVTDRRPFSATSVSSHGDWSPPKPGEELYITFMDKDGDEHKIAVSKGDNLLDIAQANDIEMEGACGGSCACSTCHVIVEDEALYDKIPEPDDDENDMLDLAFGLTETSRLGCQVLMTPELDGLRVKLPSMTRNMQASDFSKKNERSA